MTWVWTLPVILPSQINKVQNNDIYQKYIKDQIHTLLASSVLTSPQYEHHIRNVYVSGVWFETRIYKHFTLKQWTQNSVRDWDVTMTELEKQFENY